MENRIKYVSIEKLWGVKNISTELFDDVNIFIGVNGSSKTTFLNLMEAAILSDITTLGSIEFEKITLRIDSENIHEIRITKPLEFDYPVVRYEFDDEESFEVPCSEMLGRPYRVVGKYRESFYALKEKMKGVLSISWLSVNRGDTSQGDFEHSDRSDRFRNLVDAKLQELVRQLVMYQLQLEAEANKVSNKFKEDVLSLMLYNEAMDMFSPDMVSKFADVDINAMQKDLFTAFNALGIAKDKASVIREHIQRIKTVVDGVKTKNEITINDVFVLALIKRTFSIIDISKNHEQQTKEIFAPIENFKKYLKGFMPDKEFDINKENSGDFEVCVQGRSKDLIPIGINGLSSGEKQLFILLSEALLQREKPYIFIADEPELSLHIGWQQKILGELLRLNPNAQIIVATHSPEIAGNFPKRVINMQNIVEYV